MQPKNAYRGPSATSIKPPLIFIGRGVAFLQPPPGKLLRIDAIKDLRVDPLNTSAGDRLKLRTTIISTIESFDPLEE